MVRTREDVRREKSENEKRRRSKIHSRTRRLHDPWQVSPPYVYQARTSINTTTATSPPYLCVDWGASYWRQYESVLGAVADPEPSLAIYDKRTNEILTGTNAAKAWLPNGSFIRFENLKKLFDRDSVHVDEMRKQISSAKVNITTDDILERWWEDRFSSILKRVPPRETITFAVAHPAYFSPQSVGAFREWFSRSRGERKFQVVVSEESTAALHGSRFSGFSAGDCVVVIDGGKSTIVSTFIAPSMKYSA